MSTSIDEHADAPLAAVADLLERAIRAHFDEHHLDRVYMRAVVAGDLVQRLPALIVFRESDQALADHDVIDDETVSLVVEYYAPTTPADSLDARWPLLRAVWKLVHSRLVAGFDPLVTPHHVDVSESGEPERMVPVLAAQGWLVPYRCPATVRYALASTELDPIPWFRAVVTMRTSEQFDWTLGGTYTHPDLKGIDGDVRVLDPDPDADPEDPPNTQPGFSSIIDF